MARYARSNTGWFNFSLPKEVPFQVINNNGPRGKPWHQLGRKRKRVLTTNINGQLEDLAAERRTEPVRIAANIIRRWTPQPILVTYYAQMNTLGQ